MAGRTTLKDSDFDSRFFALGTEATPPMPRGFAYAPADWHCFSDTLAENVPPGTQLETYRHGTEVGFTLHGKRKWQAEFYMLRGKAHISNIIVPASKEGMGLGSGSMLAIGAAFATMGKHSAVTFTAERGGSSRWSYLGAGLDMTDLSEAAHKHLLPHLCGYAVRHSGVPDSTRHEIIARAAAGDRHILPWLIHDSGLGAIAYQHRNLATDMIVTAPGNSWDGRIELGGAENDLCYMLGIHRGTLARKGITPAVVWQPPV